MSRKTTANLIAAVAMMSLPFARQASGQEVDWALSGGGTSSDEGFGIAVDGGGNSYLTGRYQDTATFGATTLVSAGDFDVFVAKVDADGNYLWALRGGGTGFDEGSGIAIDASGNSYLTGRFQGTATFGTTTLVSAGSSDVFLAKVGPDGNYLWALRGGGGSFDEGFGIAVDPSGNSYLTGRYFGSATFGTATLVSAGSDDLFVIKVAPDGNFLWALRGGGTSSDQGLGIAADAFGNSYLTGRYKGSATFGATTLVSSGNFDVLVAEFNGPPTCSGDTDQSGAVDVVDLVAVITSWGDCDLPCATDLNGDGAVDVLDLVLVILNWGAC